MQRILKTKHGACTAKSSHKLLYNLFSDNLRNRFGFKDPQIFTYAYPNIFILKHYFHQMIV